MDKPPVIVVRRTPKRAKPAQPTIEPVAVVVVARKPRRKFGVYQPKHTPANTKKTSDES
jgi:hypothetical protein